MTDLKSFLRPFFIVALLIPLAIQCTSGGRGGPRPNILIVLVDDMGYGHLGVHYEEYTAGNVNQDLLKRSATRNDAYSLDMALEATRSSMPTLTKLAAGGVNFLDSHSGHSLCAPSRAALLTARYPQQMGIYNNGDMNSHGVPEDVLMLPELFQQNGYSTAMIG
ncbi:MAG: sulfatase-like hydrolase/transferase, partial [Bacteroidales bacterium]|nr:sulfatase-like hydrolase/transferase [Bacteroidales bacterium]